MKQGQKKLLMLSLGLPALALLAVLLTPVNAAAQEGCYYRDVITPHGSCGSNNCWFWEPGIRCNDGAWMGGCGCAPLIDGR